MGKKKVISEENLNDMLLPKTTDILGVSFRLISNDRVFVKCKDGKERICQIRGKMKRRVWIRVGDIVLVSPWDFQSNRRGEIIWRYNGGQVELLRKEGVLTV